MKLKYLIYVLLFSVVFACEKDNFEDPNGGIIEGDDSEIVLELDTQFQTINHFGASDAWASEFVGNWPDNSKNPFAELLFSKAFDTNGNPKGIGLSMWRFNIGDGSADQPDSGYSSEYWNRETECFLNPDGSYNWNKQAGSVWFLNKAKEYGVESFTAWTDSPPYFMTKNNYTFRTSEVNGYNLDESKITDYAAFLANVVKRFRDNGYNFVALSPFNEPQYPWSGDVGSASQSGSYATNSEIVTVTKAIDAKLTELNVDTEIIIPEAGDITYLYQSGSDLATSNQVNAFFNSASSNYLGDLNHISKNVAAHSYWTHGDTSASIDSRKTLNNYLKSYGAELNFWQTEYSILGADYRQGQDWTTFTPAYYALWLAGVIHKDLVYGNATGWSFWTAIGTGVYEDHLYRFSLIDWNPDVDGPSNTDGTHAALKNLWALGNYSRFVRPGMIRFNVVDSKYGDVSAVDNFMISGYLNPTTKQIVLVCINKTNSSRDIKFKSNGTDLSVAQNEFDMYTTSNSQNLNKTTVNNGLIAIPPQSIVTLTAKLN